jgi:hypothetical protein
MGNADKVSRECTGSASISRTPLRAKPVQKSDKRG